MPEVLTVLTYKSADHIVGDHGTQSWVLNRPRALACRYVVCARHQHGPWRAEGPEPHKHAFLVGRITGVEPSDETSDRWRVEFDEFALVDGPKLPLRSKSPVQYFSSLDELGIDEGSLRWQAVTSRAAPAARMTPPISSEDGASKVASSLQMPADVLMSAKAMVASRLGVPPDAIEISVRF